MSSASVSSLCSDSGRDPTDEGEADTDGEGDAERDAKDASDVALDQDVDEDASERMGNSPDLLVLWVVCQQY